MKRFVLKRVGLLLPGLIIVMIVAFFLSRMVPGDAAESMMLLEGIKPESSNSAAEYERHYMLLHLDKPLFYFSIIPDFYPDNIHAITDATERHQVRSLLNQKIDYSNVQNYINERSFYLKTIKEWNTKQDFNKQTAINNLLSKVVFAEDAKEIRVIWQTLVNSLPDSLGTFKPLINSTENLVPKTYYVPSFRWHGSGNQFHIWVSSLLSGNLGISIKDGREVSGKIWSALKWTLFLSLANLILSSFIAIPSGLYSGFYAGSVFDKISNFIWLLLYSIPVFWLASLLIVYCTSAKYSTWLDIFPIPGLWYTPDGQSFFTTVHSYSNQLILPLICLVANDIAQLSRLVRNRAVEQKSSIYVLMAKAKGANDSTIMTKHILPNILIPLITVVGGKLPAGLSGALVIEVIFNIPGMGRLMYNSLFASDWNVVFGILLMVSMITMLSMLITDLLYAYANPKIKTEIG